MLSGHSFGRSSFDSWPCWIHQVSVGSFPSVLLKSHLRSIWVFPKIGGTPKWMVYNGKPYWNGWFGGTTIFGNIHISLKKNTMLFFFRLTKNLPEFLLVGLFLHKKTCGSAFWLFQTCGSACRCSKKSPQPSIMRSCQDTPYDLLPRETGVFSHETCMRWSDSQWSDMR